MRLLHESGTQMWTQEKNTSSGFASSFNWKTIRQTHFLDCPYYGSIMHLFPAGVGHVLLGPHSLHKGRLHLAWSRFGEQPVCWLLVHLSISWQCRQFSVLLVSRLAVFCAHPSPCWGELRDACIKTTKNTSTCSACKEFFPRMIWSDPKYNMEVYILRSWRMPLCQTMGYGCSIWIWK